MTTGEHLVNILHKRGMTVKDLALLMNVPTSKLSKVKNGKPMPLELILECAKALDITPDLIYEGTDENDILSDYVTSKIRSDAMTKLTIQDVLKIAGNDEEKMIEIIKSECQKEKEMKDDFVMGAAVLQDYIEKHAISYDKALDIISYAEYILRK